jgi:hypothetical protein
MFHAHHACCVLRRLITLRLFANIGKLALEGGHQRDLGLGEPDERLVAVALVTIVIRLVFLALHHCQLAVGSRLEEAETVLKSDQAWLNNTIVLIQETLLQGTDAAAKMSYR